MSSPSASPAALPAPFVPEFGPSMSGRSAEEERETLINLISAQQDLEAAIERAETARSTARLSVGSPGAEIMPKVIVIDGKRSIGMQSSVEEVMAIVRTLYGRDVQLTGAAETDQQGETVLELSFERPSGYSLTRQLATYNVF